MRSATFEAVSDTQDDDGVAMHAILQNVAVGAEGDVEFSQAMRFAVAKIRMLGELVGSVQDEIDGPVGR